MAIYLWISFGLTLVYLLLMALYAWGVLKSDKSNVNANLKDESLPRFSIIIPARNEAENISACLQSIIDNQYPKDLFEIILIDDFSDDNTASLATAVFEAADVQYKLLSLSSILSLEQRKQLNAFKKKALEIGIQQAKGQYIITTDADCTVPKTWLSSIAQKLLTAPQLQCVAAPVNFIPYQGEKSVLYYFQSIDFMTMQGITIAANKLNMGNMSNGANFIFAKQAFETVGGYKGIDHKASGDDMMLMQKIQMAYPNGIGFLYNQSAIVDTPVQADWTSFLNQRIRWASKADSYPQARLSLTLLLVYLFNFNFLGLVICSFFSTNAFLSLGIILMLKILAELCLVIPLSIFFKKRNELLFLIILQPIHILYIIAAGFLGKFGKYTWKGRVVK